jgi:hypothetical protein
MPAVSGMGIVRAMRSVGSAQMARSVPTVGTMRVVRPGGSTGYWERWIAAQTRLTLRNREYGGELLGECLFGVVLQPLAFGNRRIEGSYHTCLGVPSRLTVIPPADSAAHRRWVCTDEQRTVHCLCDEPLGQTQLIVGPDLRVRCGTAQERLVEGAAGTVFAPAINP